MPGDDYGLLLHDPEGSSKETDIYRDEGAEEEDTSTSTDLEAAEGKPSAARPVAGDA